MPQRLELPRSAKRISSRASSGKKPLLTNRELTILQLVADGMSNREIAEKLTLSPTTVKWYVKQIFNKLGANRRTQMVKMASELHLMEVKASEFDLASASGIPVSLMPLVGREKEINETIDLLNQPKVRLITILGVGGVGKTRLALEVARRETSQMPGLIRFVALDSVTSLSGLIQAMASAIGLQFHGSQDIGRQFLTNLRNRKLVLVLDNFEHLQAAAHFVNEMLTSAPRIKILTTSCERLDLSAETVYSLHGLDFPRTAQHAQNYAAFRLFLQVARYSQPAFQPAADEVVHICRLCQLVEGMPLAIELPAKWIDVLTPAQIVEEMLKGIDILHTTRKDMAERHRSIHAVFERSWQLLADEERELFKKLCVFRGGFDRAAAEAVTGATLFSLSTLVDKSLVTRISKDRFNLHELARQFAEEKLRVDPNEYTLVFNRHCQYFGDLMRMYEKKIKVEVSSMSESLLAGHDNYDNILAGWHYAIEAPLLPEIGKYVFSISGLFQSRGLSSEVQQTFAQALNLLERSTLPEDDPTRVRLMTHYGWFLQSSSDKLELACKVLQKALKFSFKLDHSHMADVGLLLAFFASALTLSNQIEAGRKNAQQGLITCQTANFQFGVWMCLTILAQVRHIEGHHLAAYDYHYQALTHADQHRNLYGTVQSLGHLSCICWALGNLEETLAYVRRVLSLFRTLLMVDTLFLTILAIAGVHELRGQPHAALEILAIVVHHPQSGSPLLGPTISLLLLRLQAQLSIEQTNAVIERARLGQLSSRFLDPVFTISAELIDPLFELLDQTPNV
jgi:predicted ATPase/DNA-binding CsgD family transcriptional regulator